MTRNAERSFGLSVGGVCLALALWSAWRGRPALAAGLGVAGGLLVALGAAAPARLAVPSRWWFRFAHLLGWVNTRVLLFVAFAVLVVPVGVVLRLTRREPLARRRAAFRGWQPYPARYRDPRHFLRMY